MPIYRSAEGCMILRCRMISSAYVVCSARINSGIQCKSYVLHACMPYSCNLPALFVFISIYLSILLYQSFHLVSKPAGGDVLWPLPRTLHPLCTLVDPDSVWGEGNVRQSIFLLWGRDTEETVAEEAGIFTLDKDLQDVSWKEVSNCG